jgi:2-polyprenyl-3-methyl-5-hydroxy-6-metoxy-1,4-benzoquinol methylase
MKNTVRSNSLRERLFRGHVVTKASVPSERFLTPSIKACLKSLAMPRAPKHIRCKYRPIDQSGLDKIADSLKRNYFAHHYFGKNPESYLESLWGRGDLEDHLRNRTHEARIARIPWLDQARALQGARILEIGCGTGSSTIAFVEQGADVTAVDVDEASMRVAQDRCEAYGLVADLSVLNATQAAQHFAGERFDFIIFYASLEHMTYEERFTAMRSTWDLLPKGSFWCVVEAPNRLWYRDDHTSCLPFFDWLPDALAFDYSRFSPREGFRSEFSENGEKADQDFLRHGRGVSYHEFDLAMKPCQELKVVSSLLGFLRRRSLLWTAKAMLDGDLRFESFLAKVGPRIHRGFFQPHLDLIIEKD